MFEKNYHSHAIFHEYDSQGFKWGDKVLITLFADLTAIMAAFVQIL